MIGYPLNMEGEKTQQTAKIEQFAELLKKTLNLPVLFQDERLTSKQSDVILSSLEIKRSKKKNENDVIAASLILQNYLNSIEEKG